MILIVYVCVCVQEPQKPDDALGYLKKSVGGSLEDKRTIEVLHKENEELKKKVRVVFQH